MSVATVAPIDGVIETGITNNWVRVKPSFFRGVAPHLESYCAITTFGIIVSQTIGLSRTWAKIGWSQFENVTKRDENGGWQRRSCELAIKQLLADGLIRQRKSTVGTGWEYALAVRSTGGDCKLATCRTCGRADDVELDLDFLPVPHSFFRFLPATCDRGMYLIMMYVIARTMKMRDKQIVSVASEITVDEFRRATGLERAEILSDLQKLQTLDVLGSTKHSRSIHYWAKPENFTNGQARPARKLNREHKERKSETPKPQKVEQPTESKQTIRPVEFVTLPCGYCRFCDVYGPMDPVLESANPVKKPIETARGAPYQSGSTKKSKLEIVAAKLKGRYA